jgi:hypothetical protein
LHLRAQTLSDVSGARVSLSQKQTSPSSERVVTIGGPLGACRVCVDMLLDTLQREPAVARYTNLSVNYTHVMTPPEASSMHVPGMGPYGAPGGLDAGTVGELDRF